MVSSDLELLRQWQQGDNAAGKELFGRYYDSVARFFRNKLHGDISDVIQDTFAACVAGRDRLRDQTSFRSYLFSIAHRQLCEHLRRRYRQGEALDLDAVSAHSLSSGPSSIVARQREERLLLEALRAIPVAYQELIELRYWEDLKTIEIAEIVELPHATVRTRLRRAHELLHEAMERLAGSRAELDSTLTRLDDWARQCRSRLIS